MRLIALGYTMVYGILRLINFAHGDIIMTGAFSAYLPGAQPRPRRPARQSARFLSVAAIMLLSMTACTARR